MAKVTRPAAIIIHLGKSFEAHRPLSTDQVLRRRSDSLGGRALCELLVDERIVWFRSLIEYLRLMLNIGSYSRTFNFAGNKKRNHSNRTSCAARHENEKSFIGGKLSRPHFPSISHLCFSRVSSHRRHPSFLRFQLQLDEATGTLQFCPACLYRHGCFQRG